MEKEDLREIRCRSLREGGREICVSCVGEGRRAQGDGRAGEGVARRRGGGSPGILLVGA